MPSSAWRGWWGSCRLFLTQEGALCRRAQTQSHQRLTRILVVWEPARLGGEERFSFPRVVRDPRLLP